MKHTDTDHPDFALLQRAEREIHDLALRINNVERESDEQEGRQQMLRFPNSPFSQQEHLGAWVGMLRHTYDNCCMDTILLMELTNTKVTNLNE